MGVATPRLLYQYKPVVQKHGETGKSAYADAISPHPETAQVALMSKQSVVVVPNSMCAAVERNCREQCFEWGFFTSPRDKVPAAGCLGSS